MRRFTGLLLLLAALAAIGPAAAQTPLSPPAVTGYGGTQVPAPTQIIGYDGGTGLPCIVGSTATCHLMSTTAPYAYKPLGCQALPSMATATGFTSVPVGATVGEVQVASENVNFRDDGTAPTSSTGLTLYPGVIFPYSGSLSAIEFIQQTATATGWVCFYR